MYWSKNWRSRVRATTFGPYIISSDVPPQGNASKVAVFDVRWVIFMMLISTVGCISSSSHLIGSIDRETAACRQFYQDMDRAIFAQHVEDSGEHRISGYPYLRSDRFLASFAAESLAGPALEQWLELLRRSDEQARTLEFANLPVPEKTQLIARLPAGTPIRQRLRECGRKLVATDLAHGLNSRKLMSAVAVPDDYQTWKRIVGFYPLARLFAAGAIEDLHRQLNQPFHTDPFQLTQNGTLVRYQPAGETSLNQREITTILTEAYRNPLQIPVPTPLQLDRLFAHFAPLWEVDTLNDNDLIGTVAFKHNDTPLIDTRTPTVYVKAAHTRYHGNNLLQLIYQIWFPSRQKTGVFDLYGGELDSVVWRVTLSPSGMPIAYDSIHACGCYYLLFPGSGYRALTQADGQEPILAPQSIGIDPFFHRLTLRLAARTHYLQRVSPTMQTFEAKTYRLIDYDRLRSLPAAHGRRRNLFNSEGIIDASHRTERYFLWPFGVASPGAMRQWGKHAIAFVGRRHFDDAFLLEKLLAPQQPPIH